MAFSMFATSVTAMKAHSNAFEIISDNLAKSDLPGFKYSEVQTSINSGNSANPYNQSAGIGTNVRNRFSTEGTTVATENPLDGALVGRGYFITRDGLTGGQNYLTESGQFRITRDTAVSTNSYLTDSTGKYVMGWNYDEASGTFLTGDTEASLGPIQVNRLSDTFAAVGSSSARVSANLNSETTVGDTHTISFNILDGSGAADGVADDRYIDMTFTKNATANLWDVAFTADNGTLTTTNIQIQFDATGNNPTIVGDTDASFTLGATWTNPAATNSFTLNLNDLTSFSGGHVLNEIASDGFEEGLLADVYLAEGGILQGQFTNGQTRPMAKLAIGDVRNPEGLYTSGSTHFIASRDSGALQIYDPETSTRATFAAGAYEASTTDANTEFTKMITAQHAYSSAATTVRTIDEMLQTATKLK